ncbi:hypothetical protein S40285_06239 [Stachybotrys chlorohalonatus IBT 40285]|uniref:GP-PDE domain-containing protein n=1 Tax=Stachybotrys chlorohalonatus (strain IBT 40285) TaxID=1283841 RepID=A0A084QEK8_STAC4|nr:hypothetical protein S40285_06239 [Stachybotrys chlorohalonata IBT 40285]
MAVETQPLLQKLRKAIPTAPWATAIRSPRDATRYIPQTIAHRGFKAEYPENSMAGFQAAVQVGAHALETDLHLSSDGVVVLTHDGNLKRTFGVDRKVNEVDWEFISGLKSVREPHLGLPRLLDLLQWLAQPGREKTWVLLDIKMDDKADDLMTALANTIVQVSAPVPWETRLVLGCWNATFLEAARRTLPEYPLAIITFSTTYARHFLPMPNVGFNMLHKSLVGLPGSWFLRAALRADRPVYAWTVNDEASMRWCIERNVRGPAAAAAGKAGAGALQGQRVIDGVITDNPKLFREVCDRWEDEVDGKAAPPARRGIADGLRGGLAHFYDRVVIQALILVFYVLQVHVNGRLDFVKDRDVFEASAEEIK